MILQSKDKEVFDPIQNHLSYSIEYGGWYVLSNFDRTNGNMRVEVGLYRKRLDWHEQLVQMWGMV